MADSTRVETADAKPTAENRYLGDQACVECHGQIAEHYAGHSMGRSLSVISELDVASPALVSLPYTFDAAGFRYSVFRDGAKLIHHQGRLTAEGAEVAVMDEEVSYVVGSGNHGRSFLINRENRLFMSPITWYPDKEIWDLSPGYETSNSEFNRPVIEVCLFCHSNMAANDSPTLNHYRDPIFHGHSIGCERCHGPGGQHVDAQQSAVAGADDVIINPGKLKPELRDAVCQQCHLSGVARVSKPGKGIYDFRPGQLLDDVSPIFVMNEPEEGEQFVGHVEQMHDSKCFQESAGKLGCISCHDPHRLPTADEKISFYRERCLTCHQTEGCSVDESERRKKTAQDSCIVCHMPKQTTEVRHAATTNHRVPRTAGEPFEPNVAKSRLPLRSFPHDKATSRDAAIALVMASSQRHSFRSRDLDAALATLRRVTSLYPDDVDALVALSELLAITQQYRDAIVSCQLVLEQQPRREQTLVAVADLYGLVGDLHRANGAWQNAIDVNPWMSRYWYELAKTYASTREWPLCRETCETAKQRFPTSIGVRQLLVESALQLGDHDSARREYAELSAFNPPGFEKLKAWYEDHPLRSQSQAD